MRNCLRRGESAAKSVIGVLIPSMVDHRLRWCGFSMLPNNEYRQKNHRSTVSVARHAKFLIDPADASGREREFSLDARNLSFRKDLGYPEGDQSSPLHPE